MGRYASTAWLLAAAACFRACGSTEASDPDAETSVDANVDAGNESTTGDALDSESEPVVTCAACQPGSYWCTTPVQSEGTTMAVSDRTSESCVFDLPGTTYVFDCVTGELCRIGADAQVCTSSNIAAKTLVFDHFGNPVTCNPE